jgi:5-methylcytosine-specific restriction endonuclease McrA
VTPSSAPSAYKKRAIPNAVRREVATRYGCPPGERIYVGCHYCGQPDYIHWWRNPNGKPSGWVSFGHELDHVIPEVAGGPTTADNLVLACRPCNRRKGAKV